MRLFSKSLAIGLPASRVGARKDGSCPSVSDRLDPPTFPTLCYSPFIALNPTDDLLPILVFDPLYKWLFLFLSKDRTLIMRLLLFFHFVCLIDSIRWLFLPSAKALLLVVMRLFSKSLAIGLPASRVGARKDGSCPSVSDRLDPPTFPTIY